MQNVWAIFKRELVGYFGSPLAYIVLTLFLGLLAMFTLWMSDILQGGVATMRVPFFWTSVSFLFLIPAITMRLVAEEQRSGSIEMLVTLPVSPLQVVTGKWLAAVALVAVALVLTLSYPGAVAILGDLDWGPAVGGYLGLLLMGAAFAAIGVATSALTDNQIVAFLLALVFCALPWVVGMALARVPAAWVPLVQYLTFDYHFANLARGVIDTRSLFFYGGVILGSLQIAATLLKHRRLS